jgi:hypothetical protein
MEILWSLGHRKTKVVEKNLYTNQLVQKVVESLLNGDSMVDWMVWRSGWTKWESITEIQELTHEVNLLRRLNGPQPTIDSAPQPPPIPDLKDLYQAPIAPKEKTQENPIGIKPEPQEKEITGAGVKFIQTNTNANQNSTEVKSETPINWGEKRQFKRVEARFRCIIKSSSITFRTFTKDVSLGGVALEDAIPNELLGNECTIYITGNNNKKNLKFKIKVTNRPGAKFFSFENVDSIFLDELNGWLEQFSGDNSDKKKVS